jgi:hypothetical protein
MRKDGALPAVYLVMAASPEFLDFAASRTLDVTNLNSNSRETSSRSYAFSYRPIASWAVVPTLSMSRSSAAKGHSLA